MGIPSLIVAEYAVKERVKRAEEDFNAVIAAGSTADVDPTGLSNAKVLDAGQRAVRINSATLSADFSNPLLAEHEKAMTLGGNRDTERLSTYSPPALKVGDEETNPDMVDMGIVVSRGGAPCKGDDADDRHATGCWARMEGVVVSGFYLVGLLTMVPAPPSLAPRGGGGGREEGGEVNSVAAAAVVSLPQSHTSSIDSNIDCRVCTSTDEEDAGP